MSKRIVQRKKEGKWVGKLVEGDKAYVGLDMHKRTVHAALWVNGRIVKTWSMPYEIGVIVASLEPYRTHLGGVVYEAGPTGFGLARALQKQGFAVTVIAPSKTPRCPGETKSDRLDCRKLAEYFAHGQLGEVAIPTEEQEADRQVWRAREQCVKKVRRVKQQIKSFLLAHGVAEPKGLGHWSLASKEALRTLALREELRFCLEELLADLEHLEAQKGRLHAKLKDLSETKRHRKTMALLDAHPGVGPLTSAAFTTEIFNPKRFQKGDQVARYVGLAPRVYQSGDTRREGKISKTGRASLRALLIEASWEWVRKDPVAAEKFKRLVRNTGSRRKAVVGMARLLAIKLWRCLCEAS